MKIALLGAPGSGKTTIARKFNRGRSYWHVVDGYVEKLQRRTGFAFGADANFAQNLIVITERWMLEWEFYKNKLNTITCGTAYESFIYSALQTYFVSATETELVRDQRFLQVMGTFFSTLAHVYYDYDALFFLPYDALKTESEQHSWHGVLNAKIPEVLAGSGKQAIVLTGTDREKVNTIKTTIKEIQEYYDEVGYPTVDPEASETALDDGPGL